MEQLNVMQEVEVDCTVEAATSSLLKCLQLVLPIVPAKSNQTPIIENFLIDISGGYLKATGYDHKKYHSCRTRA